MAETRRKFDQVRRAALAAEVERLFKAQVRQQHLAARQKRRWSLTRPARAYGVPPISWDGTSPPHSEPEVVRRRHPSASGVFPVWMARAP